jgi:glycosyltransferase involved in cell wall biosynthesis
LSFWLNELNILFLSELFYPHGSGAELATYNYADMLSKAGCRITVVTNKFGEEAQFSKVNSFNIIRIPLFDGSEGTKFSVLTRIDVLVSNFLTKLVKWSDVVYVPRFWFSAILLAKSCNKPVITHLHDYIPICPLSTSCCLPNMEACKATFCKPRCIYAFEKRRGRNLRKAALSTALNLSIGQLVPRLVRFSDAIICVSKNQRDNLLVKQGSLRDKMHVIYNPVSDFINLEIAGRDFGYFGGLDPLKGFQVLLAALKRRSIYHLENVKINATKFEIIDPSVLKLLEKLGITPYGKVSLEEFRRIYKSIRTVLVPSLWNEPWPYGVVEALLQRRLLVASAIGGIPEQVEGCDGAILSRPGDSKQLAETIEFVNGLGTEQTVNLGWRNREGFLQRFNNESSIRKFINICDHLT